MKKLCMILLSLALLAGLSAPALAADIQVNGKAVADAEAVTMVPLRAVSEALGFTVTWDGSLPGARLDNGQAHIDLTLGKDQYQLVSSKAIGMSAPFSLGAAPAMLEKGTIYVPAKLFGVLLGSQADAVVIGADGTVSSTAAGASGGVEIINPLHEHDTLEALEKAVGFDVTAPAVPAGFTASLYQDIAGTLAEIRFTNGDKELSYRVSQGAEDNSGDSSLYAETSTMTVDGVAVECRGGDSRVNVAVWVQGGYVHSLRAPGGLTVPQVRQMVESML